MTSRDGRGSRASGGKPYLCSFCVVRCRWRPAPSARRASSRQPPPTAIQPVEYNDREGEHQAGVFVGVIFSIFNIIVRAAVVLTTKWQNKSAREGRNGHRRSPWPKSRSYVSKPPRARSPQGGQSSHAQRSSSPLTIWRRHV